MKVKADIQQMRIQVPITYECNRLSVEAEDKFFDKVENVGDFKCRELQKQGCCHLGVGFVIFESEPAKIPTKEELRLMTESVRIALRESKKANPYY